MSDEHLDRIKALFKDKKYSEIIREWSAETSNSDAFKRAAFQGYTPVHNDVVVSTYPKCGTTWMNPMVLQIGFKGDCEYEHIDGIVPWPDKLIRIDFNPALDDRSILADSPTGVHVIKSHLESEYVPIVPEGKYISVIRNPKDAIVSSAMFENGFNQLLFGETIPTDAWVDAFMTPHYIYQPWTIFIDSWWRLRDEPNVKVFIFEDIKRDPDSVIREVTDFLGVSLTDEEFDKVREKTSFAYMKANDEKFAPPAWNEGYVPLVREGKSGNSKELLSEEQQQAIDAHCITELEKLGSEFPYRALYGNT